MDNVKDYNIALITNIISPYRIPVWNYLAIKSSKFKVFFLGEIHNNRKWKISKDEIKFEYEILRGFQFFIQKMDWGFHINYGLISNLVKGEFDVIVVAGYDSPAYYLALIYCQLFRKKFVFWNGSNLQSSRVNSFLVNNIRRLFIKTADAYLAYGKLAKEFLVTYGAVENKVVVGCNTVDIKKFKRESTNVIPNREKIKKQKGFPAINILFSGQLIKRKGLPVLLKAFKVINSENVGLIILGDGPERDNYLDYCKVNRIENVFFEGHQPLERLPEYYAISDIFVLPSFVEVWGLVVNEAMACGLPVICSKKAGVAKDLIRDGVNGYTYEPNDFQTLSQRLSELLSDGLLRKEMGKKSSEMIAQYTPQKYAEDLMRAIELA